MIKLSLFSRPFAGMALLALSLLISACGGGGGGSTGSGGAATNNVVTSNFAGSVGDGPIVGATVSVYDRNGTLLQTVVSDGFAYYSTSLDVEENAYPLILEVNDGTDLVTGRAPDFKLTSVVLHPSATHANINPYTTFMVEIARNMPGGITAANISAARVIVMGKLNFGLDPAFVDDPLGTQITDQNVAVMVKSSEVLGEMIRRTRDHLMAIGVVASGDDVVAMIAQDLTDGKLDGLGGSLASNRVAAVSKLTAAQVLIEALSNNLKVGNTVATGRMDNAIITTRPSVPLSLMTDSVPVNQALLVQVRDSIKVAQSLSPSGELDTIATTLDSLLAGSLASEVESELPANTSAALNQPIAVAIDANDDDLNAALQVTSPPVVNTAPVISGNPGGSVTANEPYTFTPSASDADNDQLTFSISGKPGWATFNSGNGQLSGTPTVSNTHSGIVISVTDNKSIPVSLPAFSITVDAAPVVNTAPVISGNPGGSVTANESYTFTPSASDADNDQLTFSISGRPGWATFNSGNGQLSGTPTVSNTHSGIVISVTDNKSIPVSLPAFSITVDAAPVVNTAPVISGNPGGSVTANESYTFTPSASDADNDQLTFSISGRPGWATFNPGNGQLSGTPTVSNTHSGIVISVTDNKSTPVSLPAFSITVDAAPVLTGSFSVSWTAPVARADGTPISLADIDGYHIYYGESSGSYPNSINVADGTAEIRTVNDVPVGTYYVVMTTYDFDGRESGYSLEVSKPTQ